MTKKERTVLTNRYDELSAKYLSNMEEMDLYEKQLDDQSRGNRSQIISNRLYGDCRGSNIAISAEKQFIGNLLRGEIWIIQQYRP